MILEIAILLGIFIVSYILILKNFELSLYVLLVLSVLLHKELFSIYRWDLLPVRMFMLSVLCAGFTHAYLWFIHKRKRDSLMKIIKNPYIMLLFTLWLIRGISIFFSKNLQASLFLYGFFTTVLVLISLMVVYFKDKPEKVLDYLKFYIFLIFGLTIFGYIQYYVLWKFGITIGSLWSIPGNIARVGATFWDVNHYAALLTSMIPTLGVLILVEKWKIKPLYVVMALSMVVTLFLTNSRSAWIMAGVSLISFVLLLLIKKWGYKGILYIFIAFLVVAIPAGYEYSIKSSPFRAKIKQYFHYRMDSFDSHFMLLTGSFQIFEKYPILGGGYGGFFEHFSKTAIASTYFGRDPAALNTRVPAHTIWGEVLSETGILGFSVFILFVVLLTGTMLYATFNAETLKARLISSAMVSTVFGWFVAGIFYSYNSEFFWIVLTLFFAYSWNILGKKFSITKLINFIAESRLFPIGVLTIIGLGLIFWNLGANHLVPWDESIYAKISKNMVINNDYINQYWEVGKVWYEKPPLYMWLMAFFMKFMGFTEWAAKFPSAIFGLVTVLTIYFFGKKLFGKSSGFLSALVLITTVHFLYYSRMAMTDITATCFITLSLFIYYCGKDRESKNILWWLSSGIFIGLAAMTKGVVGLLPLPIIFLYELYLLISKQQSFSFKLFINYFCLLLSSVAVIAPWHYEMWRRYGDLFINTYIGYHVINRATTGIEDKGRPFFWYITVMRVSMRIWFIGLISSLPLVLFKLFRKNNAFVFLSIWSLFVFLFFSSAQSKLVWYIIPLYPVVALFVGYFIEKLLSFIIEYIQPLNELFAKTIAIYLLVICSLMYLFYNRELAYPSDLTGPQANLLTLKDTVMGTDTRIYVDRVELPLVMFYSDSPFEIIDFNPSKGRFPIFVYNEDLIILAKKGRYSEVVPQTTKTPIVLGEEGDWILFYYVSDYKLDSDKISALEKEISELESKQKELPLTNADITKQLTTLYATRQELLTRIQNK